MVIRHTSRGVVRTIEVADFSTANPFVGELVLHTDRDGRVLHRDTVRHRGRRKGRVTVVSTVVGHLQLRIGVLVDYEAGEESGGDVIAVGVLKDLIDVP